MRGKWVIHPAIVISFLVAGPAMAASYKYTTLNAPGQAVTFGFGLDNRDVVVGQVHDNSNTYQGFVFERGGFTLVPAVSGFDALSDTGLAVGTTPAFSESYVTYRVNGGATQSYSIRATNQVQLSGINAAGTVIASSTSDFKNFRALWLHRSVTRPIRPPAARTSNGAAINDAGVAVGYYTDTSKHEHGFSYSAGAVTSFDAPASASTLAVAIGPDGTIGGSYSSAATGQYMGFTKAGDTFTTINPPGADYSIVDGINGARVVGSWLDSAAVQHGFVYQGGVYSQIDVPGAASTHIQSVNALGSLLGTYMIGSTTYSFLAQCPTGQTCTH